MAGGNSQIALLVILGCFFTVIIPIIIIELNELRYSNNPYINLFTKPQSHTINVDYPDSPYNIKTTFSLESREYNSLSHISDDIDNHQIEEDGFLIELPHSEKDKKATLLYRSKDHFRQRVNNMKQIKKERDTATGEEVLDTLVTGSSKPPCWECGSLEPMFRAEGMDTIWKVNNHITYCATRHSDKEQLCCDCMIELYESLTRDESIDLITLEEEFALNI